MGTGAVATGTGAGGTAAGSGNGGGTGPGGTTTAADAARGTAAAAAAPFALRDFRGFFSGQSRWDVRKCVVDPHLHGPVAGARIFRGDADMAARPTRRRATRERD